VSCPAQESEIRSTSGNTLVEYLLILLLVVLVVVLFYTILGTETSEPIGNFANQMNK